MGPLAGEVGETPLVLSVASAMGRIVRHSKATVALPKRPSLTRRFCASSDIPRALRPLHERPVRPADRAVDARVRVFREIPRCH